MLYNVPPGDGIAELPVPEVEFNLRNFIYTWQAPSGYTPKLDIINLPILAIVVKLASNLPVRVRLYQSDLARQVDLARPPHIDPKDAKYRGIFLDAILGGVEEELQLNLSPVLVIANAQQCYLTLEKLEPQSATINLNLSFIG